MADPVKLTDKFVAQVPYLLKEMTFTAGTGAAAFDHGGPGVPTFMLTRNGSTNPTATEAAVYGETATAFTLDCEAAAGTVYVYLFWIPQADQDGQTINADNNT